MVAKRIVVTESSELLAFLAASFFHREGFTLFPVNSGDMAFRLVEAEAPAMAIIDLAVLGSEGLACCRRIKLDPLLRKTPLLLLLPEERSRTLLDGCRQAGGDAVIARPLEESCLFDAVCSLLGVNRRLARRVPVDFPLTLAAAGGKRRAGKGVNLNAGGLFVAAEKLYPVDTTLLLEFTLPGSAASYSCRGRVAWVNHPEWRKKTTLPHGMGVEFLDPPPGFQAKLQDYSGGFALDN
jgi:uncharacterized protein (TIGR02266 family)